MEMTYEEYQTYVLQNMNTVDGFSSSCVASLHKITKNNGIELVGLSIHEPDVNFFFQMYFMFEK